MLSKSDKVLGIVGSREIYSSYYSYYKFPKSTERSRKLLKALMPMISQYYDLPNKIKFRLGTHRIHFGSYSSISRVVFVAVNIDLRKFVETICHELTHAEQFHLGKLQVKKNNFFWMGSKGSKGTTYNSYFNSPWEVEARSKAEEVMKSITSEQWEELAVIDISGRL